MARGKFIVFEGMDGVGKSEQALRAFHHVIDLTSVSRDLVRLVKTPGNAFDPMCVDIRNMLFKRDYSLGMGTMEMGLLFFIDYYRTCQYVNRVLGGGGHVIADRWSSISHLAHNALRRGETTESDRLYHQYRPQIDPRPDLILVLDCDPAVARARCAARTGKDVAQAQKQWGERPDLHDVLRRAYTDQAADWWSMEWTKYGGVWYTIGQEEGEDANSVFQRIVPHLNTAFGTGKPRTNMG